MLAMPYMLPRALNAAVPVGMEGIEATYGLPYGVPGLPGLPGLPAAAGLPGMLPCPLVGAPMEPYALPTMLRGAMPPAGVMPTAMATMPQAAHAAMMRMAAQPGLSTGLSGGLSGLG